MAIDHSSNRDAFGYWLSGFTDGEGCFWLGWTNNGAKGTYRRAVFVISLRADDQPLLHQIRDYLGVGNVGAKCVSSSKPQCTYSCTSLPDLFNVIIPHFERYSLRSKKAIDFDIWKRAVILMTDVSKRPSHCKGITGSIPRYTEADRIQFDEFVMALRRHRQFDHLANGPNPA